MTDVYLYTPRGYSPGYAYGNFDDALAHLLKDENVASLEELSEDLRKWDVWFEFNLEYKHIYIDDGARIEEIELR